MALRIPTVSGWLPSYAWLESKQRRWLSESCVLCLLWPTWQRPGRSHNAFFSTITRLRQPVVCEKKSCLGRGVAQGLHLFSRRRQNVNGELIMQGRALVKQPTTPEPFSAIHGELNTLVKELVHSNTHRLTGREDLTMASPDAFQSACGRRVFSWRGQGQPR